MSARQFYLDKAAVCEAVALSESTVEKLVRENEFPKPRILSGRRVAWLVREIEEWAEARPVSELLPPKNTAGRKLSVAAQAPQGGH
jgi:prophage regulatory protein